MSWTMADGATSGQVQNLNARRSARLRTFPPTAGCQAGTDSLAHRLAKAEIELEDHNEVGSHSSEGRDVLSGRQRAEEELEKRSTTSSCSSEGRRCSTNPPLLNDAEAAHHAAAGSSSGSCSGNWSGTSNHSSTGQAILDLKNRIAEGDVENLDGAILNVAAKFDSEILELQQKLRSAEEFESSKEKEQIILLRDAKQSSIIERDELQDEHAALKARYNARMQTLKMELDEERSKAKKAEELVSKVETQQELQMIEQLNVATDAQIICKNEQALIASQAEVANLSQLLDNAVEVFTSRAEDDDRLHHKDEEMQKVQEALQSTRDSTRAINNELSELRVGLMRTRQAEQALNLQTLLDAAQSKESTLQVGARSHRGAGSQRGRQKKQQSKMCPLASIDEDEDDNYSIDGSVTASCQMSSNGGEEDTVGDLKDFDDDEDEEPLPENLTLKEAVKVVVSKKEELIQTLIGEVHEERRKREKLKEEMAGKDAQLQSKAARLQQQLAIARDAKQEIEEEAARRTAELNTTVRMLAVAQQQLGVTPANNDEPDQEKTNSEIGKEDDKSQRTMEDVQRDAKYEITIEDMQQKLHLALEAKRIAFMRLEDTKREMTSMDSRHKIEVADLKEQLRFAGISDEVEVTSQPSHALGAKAEMESLRQQLRSWEQERNTLVHKLEWKEVQWKGKLDSMELQQAAEVGQLKQHYETEVQEMKQQLEEAQEQTRKASARGFAPPPPPPPSFLGLLKCPVRSFDAPGRQSAGRSDAAHCQTVCWKVLNSVPGVSALLCSTEGLEILEASKKSCMIWGSAALHGQSLLTLVHQPMGAAWLKRAIETHQKLAEVESGELHGFLMRELGCIEFRDKAGRSFDSTVITAHMPAEPRCAKLKAMLIIFQPLVEEAHGRRGGMLAGIGNQQEDRGGMGSLDDEVRRGGRPSSHSVVSEDVAPSDSVSRVVERRWD